MNNPVFSEASLDDSVRKVTETCVRAFHQNEIRQRKQGKTEVDYIEANSVIDRLNEAVTPLGWSYEPHIPQIIYDIDNHHKPSEVYVAGVLTIHTPWGNVIKSQVGTADVKYTDEYEWSNGSRTATGRKVPLGVGEDIKSATTDALKKCATLLGIYNHGYRKDKAVSIDEDTKAVIEELRKAYKDKGWTSQQFLDFASGVIRKTILGPGDLSLTQAQLVLSMIQSFSKPPITA